MISSTTCLTTVPEYEPYQIKAPHFDGTEAPYIEVTPTYLGWHALTKDDTTYIRAPFSLNIKFLDETLRPTDLEMVTHDVFENQLKEHLEPINASSFDPTCCFRFTLPEDMNLENIRKVEFKDFFYTPLIEVKHLDDTTLEFERRYIFALNLKAKISIIHPTDDSLISKEVDCTAFGFRLNPILLDHRLISSFMENIGYSRTIEKNRQLAKILYAKKWSEIEEPIVNFLAICIRPRFFDLLDDHTLHFGTTACESHKRPGTRKKTVRFNLSPEVREIELISEDLKPDLFYSSKDFSKFRRDRNIVIDALDDPTDEDYDEAVFLSTKLIPERNCTPLRGRHFPVSDISKACKVVFCSYPRVITDSSLMPLHRSTPLRTRCLDYVSSPSLTMEDWFKFRVNLVKLILTTYPSLW